MTRRTQPFRLVPLAPIIAFTLLALGLGGCSRDEQPAETQDQAQSEAPAPESTPSPGGTPAPAPDAGVPGEGAQPGGAQPVDPAQLPAVVARVNGQEIKKEFLVERAQQMRVQLTRARGVQVPLSSEFYREILDGIIAHQLLLEEAKTLGITITDAEADQMMLGFKSQFPSQEVFQKQLEANKITEAELRRRMREDGDSKVNKLIQTRIASTVQVSDADARAFYDKNRQRMQTPPRAHVRHILIGLAPQASTDDRKAAHKKAQDLLQQLQNGGDFAQLAAQNSNDTGSAARGGDLSWIRPGQMVPAFEKAAFALQQPNELSPVVQTRFGFHILQLVEREEAQVVPFEQAKGRLEVMLREEKVKQALRAHVQELKSKGKVETYI